VTEPVWLEGKFVRALHDRYLAEFGGFPGVRDEGALESSLMRARWRHSMTGAAMAECAAAYAFAFATSHAFHDGNKRTAYFTAASFLEVNGYDLIVESDEVARDVMIAVATREMSEEALAAWIAARMRPRRR
jgi:death-on-curing protein